MAAPVSEKPVPDDTDAQKGPNHIRRRIISVVVACGLAIALAAILFDHSSPSTSNSASTGNGTATQGTVSNLAPGIDQASASLMQLNVLPPAQAPTAPAINGLVDQHGRPFNLASLKGKTVVWSLNDDRCTDLCTLFAEDTIAADKDLGPAAKDVVYVSINANPFYTKPADVLAWSKTNAVESLPNWVYLTGSPAALGKTWADYKVTVIQDAKTKTVSHDASVQFIDPSGKIRGLGYFDTGAISTAYYGHTMAQMANDLLPEAEQVAVGGPAVLAKSTSGATVGSTAPSFDLKALRGTGAPVSLAGADAKPLVLNFWSSTCTVCVQEMPALQQVYNDYGGKLNVVGVDVADPRGAAASFASHVGAKYQVLADPDGATAAAYKVDALPVTFIIGTDGSILARNEGRVTAPQLEAILPMDFPQLPQT